MKRAYIKPQIEIVSMETHNLCQTSWVTDSYDGTRPGSNDTTDYGQIQDTESPDYNPWDDSNW